MTLYSKILLFFIGLIILLSVVTTYSGIESIGQIAVQELDRGLNSDINLFSFAVDREFYHIESRVELFSRRAVLMDAVAGRNKEKLRELLAERVRAENIDVLHVTDDAMRPIVTVRRDTTSEPLTLPAMDPDSASRGFTMIRLGNEEIPALFISVPLKEHKVVLSEFLILDSANSLIRNLSELLSRKRDEPVYVSVFRDEKRVFSTIFAVTGRQTEDLPEDIIYTLHREKKNYIGKTTIGNNLYYTIYKPSPYNTESSAKWSYGIAVSENIFLPFKKRLLLTFILISVLATSAVIFITFLITRGIKPSLQNILEACGQIEQGKTDARIDEKRIKIREFGLIASSINKMSEAIAERKAIIEENLRKISAINVQLEDKTIMIRQDRMRFLSILETMDEGVVAIDHEGAIIYYNKAAAGIMGMDKDRVLGENYRNLFPSLDMPRNNHTAVHEFVLGSKSSAEDIYLKVYVSPWSLEDEPSGHILLLQDISNEKKVEEFKADFVSSINHDIRSFLTPVSGFLKRILRGKYGAIEGPLKERLVGIDENVTKVQHLVENYLNVSKIESGKLDLAIGPVEINDIIRDIANLYSPRVKFSGEGHCLALADKDYIERVVINLVSNALKFSPDNSEVHINSVPKEDLVEISVIDQGIGIPDEEIPLIFAKYNRGTLGTRKEGTGLGLFIVKTIVEGHGGSIWVESTPGKGSAFHFTLPLFRGEI
ncbi:MAG: ATP-binding protein [Syntrophorhabdaceae bacterium]